MRRVFLFVGLFTVLSGLSAQSLGVAAPWSSSPSEAEREARSFDKPMVLLWQAGADAPLFTQGVERLFSVWGDWMKRVAAVAVFTRGRAWEGPLPVSFPVLPDSGKSSALMVWNPNSLLPPTIWREVPAVLDLSRAIASSSTLPLPDPYTIDIGEYLWDKGSLLRTEQGPLWSGTDADGTTQWIEEGPLGSVLVLRQIGTLRKAAFPLEGDWSFLYDSATQSWAPWNAVLVKRR